MLVPKSVIKEIKDRLDIVDIIREYLPNLKRAGRNWVGLCPFHNDKNPSLNISTDIGIFKCFSCGEGGDVIGFIKKIENISFVEAVKILAKRAGIQLNINSYENNENLQKREELLQFNNRVINLFQYFLLERTEGKRGLEYLKHRGITLDLIKLFKIGYAPREYNRLVNLFFKKGFKEDFLLQTGIINRGKKGLKPLFFDRIIFPIINQKDECVGFGGRALSNDIMPKYINTPETILYKKSKNLFGINNAKNTMRENRQVFIVEGYLDVISCYKSGLKNVVAPCGTAVTKDQILLLNRYSDEIILFLDGDAAGKKGAVKVITESSGTLLKKSVLLLPDNLDPDDYFKKNTLEDFNEFKQKRVDGFDFLTLYKTDGIDNRDYKKLVTGINSIFDYIFEEENELVRISLVKRLAGILKIDEGTILREFENYKIKRSGKQKYIKKEDVTVKKEDFEKKELSKGIKREIDLILFLLNLDSAERLIKQCSLKKEHFLNAETRNLFEFFFLENNSIDKKNFIDVIDDNKLKYYVENRLFSHEFSQKEDILINNCIDRIIDVIKNCYKTKNSEINKKLKLGELYQDNELVKDLQEEKQIIINEITKLSKLQELKK